jgi:hypothetical protein
MITIKTREELLDFFPKNSIGAEIGIFKGEFSKLILKKIQPALFYMIDPWEGNIVSGDKNGNNVISIQGELHYASHILPEFGFLPNTKILRHYSDIINIFPDEYLDWIYIDAEHSYFNVKNDLYNSFSKVKKGGIISGHDYNNDMFPGVVRAVTELCNDKQLSISYLTEDGCPSFYIIK